MITQRRLLHELRIAIDRAERTYRAQDREYMVRLYQENLPGSSTKYIWHNIGSGRAKFLERELELAKEGEQ